MLELGAKRLQRDNEYETSFGRGGGEGSGTQSPASGHRSGVTGKRQDLWGSPLSLANSSLGVSTHWAPAPLPPESIRRLGEILFGPITDTSEEVNAA